jgi:hypothetical protein
MKTNLALVLVLLALSARAQMPPEGTTVHITLSSDLCRAVKSRESRDPDCRHPIDVVYNENDVGGMACLTAPPCTWTWTVRTALNPKITPFSLRLGPNIGRTRCRRATASNLWNLDVTFTRAGADHPALKFDIDGPPVYYMRVVQPVDRGDVQCREKRLLSSTVSDVQFADEDLRLQVYKKKAAYCGVVVDELLRKGGDVSIGPNELAPAVMNQGLGGKLCYAPTLVDPEIVKASFRKNKPAFTVKVVK